MLFFWPYVKSLLRSALLKKLNNDYDLVLVIPRESAGWILEAICKEIVRFYQGKHLIVYSIHDLPVARNYFFAHHIFFMDAIKVNPILWKRNTLVFHTHEKTSGKNKREFNFALRRASTLICMNSTSMGEFVKAGFDARQVTYVIAGADETFFKYHERGNGAVGFSTAYYERKNPDMILELVERMPHRKFILLGKNWEKYPKYERLKASSNLMILEIPYSEFPEQYGRMDVFVSVSKLEGGPIPVIEAMMSNVVPVASRTGFVPDVVKHGENGFIFDTDASPDEVAGLIEKAFEMKSNVRQSALHLTWRNFSLNIQKFLQ